MYATVLCRKRAAPQQPAPTAGRHVALCMEQLPAQRPADFWREGADLSGFGTIRVPGHMETQGYGQLQYTNTLYPWDGRSALRPRAGANDDPVGGYAPGI